MPWKSIDPQLVRATIDGREVEVTADRWDDFTGAIGCPGPPEASAPPNRLTVLAGEYTAIDEASFEKACAAGIRL